MSLLNDPLIVSDIYISRTSVSVDSSEIAGASLHVAIPWYTHIYGIPFISLYPLLAYAYYVKYDQWLVSEEWTFLACVSLGAGHALSFLITKWHSGARAWITTKKVRQDSFPFSSSVPLILTCRPIPLLKPIVFELFLTFIAAKAKSFPFSRRTRKT